MLALRSSSILSHRAAGPRVIAPLVAPVRQRPFSGGQFLRQNYTAARDEAHRYFQEEGYDLKTIYEVPVDRQKHGMPLRPPDKWDAADGFVRPLPLSDPFQVYVLLTIP